MPAVLWNASANRIKFCLSRSTDIGLFLLGPVLIVLATGLIGLCAHVHFSIVMKYWHPSGNAIYWLHAAFASFLVVLIEFNYILAVVSPPGYITDDVSRKITGMEISGWLSFGRTNSDPSIRTCRKCLLPKPDRSHHCSICKRWWVFDSRFDVELGN